VNNLAHTTIHGTSIYYETQGEGKNLVFIHGACENLAFWNHQRILSDRYKLFLIDLPSHGRSKPLANGPVEIGKYAEIVNEFVSKFCDDKVVLVGHSMGGAISLTSAITKPDKLSGLVLIGTGAKLGVLPSIREGLRARFDETVKTVVGPRQFASTTNLEIIRFVTNEMIKCKGDVASSDYEACNGFDVRQKLRTIMVPSLIVVGEEDKMAPVPWSTYLKENMPKAKLVILKQASHLPMLERPADFNRQLVDFVMSL
jgi:pimeloyl-ACP methyl ester carboxylesterase